MEKWKERDSLQKMVSKFNELVEELEMLKTTSSQTNETTQKQINDLSEQFQTTIQSTTQQIMSDLEDISDELARKIESESDDIELEDTDLNVSDINRPVSIPQQEAINAAKAAVLAVAEEKLTSEEIGGEISGEDSPEVSPEVKAYVEKMIIQALAGRDLKAHYLNNKLIFNTPQPGVIGYDIASMVALGMVKASTDVQVDPVTGKMSVPQLAALSERVESINTTLSKAYSTLLKGVQVMARDIGNIKALNTKDKQDLVSAINELQSLISENDTTS